MWGTNEGNIRERKISPKRYEMRLNLADSQQDGSLLFNEIRQNKKLLPQEIFSDLEKT